MSISCFNRNSLREPRAILILLQAKELRQIEIAHFCLWTPELCGCQLSLTRERKELGFGQARVRQRKTFGPILIFPSAWLEKRSKSWNPALGNRVSPGVDLAFGQFFALPRAAVQAQLPQTCLQTFWHGCARCTGLTSHLPVFAANFRPFACVPARSTTSPGQKGRLWVRENNPPTRNRVAATNPPPAMILAAATEANSRRRPCISCGPSGCSTGVRLSATAPRRRPRLAGEDRSRPEGPAPSPDRLTH